MGAVKELLMNDIIELSELTSYSERFLMSSWFKYADRGFSFEMFQSLFLQKSGARKYHSHKPHYNNCFTFGGK